MNNQTNPPVKGKSKKLLFPFKLLWLLIGFSILAITATIIIALFPYNKVHTIDDAYYVQQLSYQAVPESVTLFDPVWGSVVIEQPEKVLACYDLLTQLPFTGKEGNSSEQIRERELSGSINFLDRPNIQFTIHEGIIVDGIAYGDGVSNTKASFLVQDLCNEFYTPENLGKLIDQYTKIIVRTDKSRTILSTSVKLKLKKEIQSSFLLRNNEELSAALQSKGTALCQIEIYQDHQEKPENGERQLPHIYIAVYENGVCIVYDVDNTMGSVMHLNANLNSVQQLLKNSAEAPSLEQNQE